MTKMHPLAAASHFPLTDNTRCTTHVIAYLRESNCRKACLTQGKNTYMIHVLRRHQVVTSAGWLVPWHYRNTCILMP